jgi:hypothetical protein
MNERIFRCRDLAKVRDVFAMAFQAAKLFTEPFEIVIRPLKDKKSREQEEKYHVIIGQIARAKTLHGKRLPSESWKRLLIDAFKHETRNDPDLASEWARFGTIELLPALNHPGFVMVGEQSRKFSVKLASAFIEWLLAFQATEDSEVAA